MGDGFPNPFNPFGFDLNEIMRMLQSPGPVNMEVARKAVETNFVMLWEYTPKEGLHFTRSVDAPLPVTEYLKAMGRFRHLSPDQISHIQSKVVENRAFVNQMAQRQSV